MNKLIAVIGAALLMAGCANNPTKPTGVAGVVDSIGKTQTSLKLIETGAYLGADQVFQRAIDKNDQVDKAKLILVIAAGIQVIDPTTTAEEFRQRVIDMMIKSRAELGIKGETPEHWGQLADTVYTIIQENRNNVTGNYSNEVDRWTAITAAVARGFERRSKEIIAASQL